MHNNPVGYDASDFVCALIEYLRKEIDRVYWNVHQKHWGGGSWDFKWWEKGFEAPSDDPDIPGIRWHSYYNWGGSPDDADWDQAEADKPNFSFDGVEVRWYKYFGRSMNVNVEKTAGQWEQWFKKCLAVIRRCDDERGIGRMMRGERRV